MKKKYFVFTIILLFALISWKLVTTQEEGTDQPKEEVAPLTLVIHGGAGTIRKENMTPELEAEYIAKLTEALDEGYAVLESGGSSADAVIRAISIMEESPLFNAGKGAVFTNEERNELDASIMDGATGNAGAVAGVTNIKSPIRAAYEVMVNSKHVMMSGTGAEQFAREQGLEIVDPEYFYTERRFNQLKRIKDSDESQLDHDAEDASDKKHGTVGAVALDKDGNIVAGTSTGGMTNKKYGRIGDSPIIGAGTFASNKTCGVSSTGHGEYFIRSVVAYDIAALMEYKNISLQEAADYVVKEKLVETGGTGGVVALDANGNVAMPFNTAGMYRGYIKKKGEAKVLIYQD